MLPPFIGLANEITNRTNAINSLRTELKTYIDEAVGRQTAIMIKQVVVDKVSKLLFCHP